MRTTLAVTCAAGPGTPSAPIPSLADGRAEQGERDPRALEGALLYAHFYLEEPLHEPLRLTRGAFEATPPAPPDDLERARQLIGIRRWSPSDCVPVYLEPAGRTWPGVVWVSFVLAQDGRVGDVRTKLDGDAPDAEAQERCVSERVAGWEFPSPRLGGRMLLRLEGTGPRRDAPPRVVRSGDPVYATSGYTKPQMKTPGCVQNAIRGAAQVLQYVSDVSRPVTVKFAIGVTGEVGRFEVMTAADVSPKLLEAIEQAVRQCAWVPGRSPEGEPVPIWVILPIRFTASTLPASTSSAIEGLKDRPHYRFGER